MIARCVLAGLAALVCAGATPARAEPYLRSGRNFSYAIYSERSLLLTRPIEDLLREVARRRDARPGTPYARPITDVYVVAHGWNFTVPEAIANWERYIRYIDARIESDGLRRDGFEPFFLFVVWPSVTRPATTSVESLLPFNLGDGLRPFSFLIDEGLFHIPSAWGQSLRAKDIALGNAAPLRYWGTTRDGLPRGNIARNDFPDMGDDVPLSSLVHELIRLERAGELGSDPSIHIVGHSFGAKVVTLAALEALHRLALSDVGSDEIVDPRGALDSLVLFNPAFHPRELAYAFDLLSSEPYAVDPDRPRHRHPGFGPPDGEIAQLLAGVPRKAIVFSERDDATGFVFAASQIALDNLYAERVQSVFDVIGSSAGYRIRTLAAAAGRSLPNPPVIEDLPSRGYETAVNLLAIPYSAASLVVTAGFSGVTTVGRKLLYLPGDWWWFTRNDPTFAPVVRSPALRMPLNALHFFAPLEELWPGGRSSEAGILRPVKHALGRTGLRAMQEGRELFDPLGPLAPLVRRESDEALGPDAFIRIGASIGGASSVPPLDPSVLYAIDATAIYDRILPGIGSHNDLRSEEPVAAPLPDFATAKLRVDFTFNFLVNFTAGARAGSPTGSGATGSGAGVAR